MFGKLGKRLATSKGDHTGTSSKVEENTEICHVDAAKKGSVPQREVCVNANKMLNERKSVCCPLHMATQRSQVSIMTGFDGELETRDNIFVGLRVHQRESTSCRTFVMKRKKRTAEIAGGFFKD